MSAIITRRATYLPFARQLRAFHTSRVAFAAAEPLNSFVAAIATPRPTPPPPPPPSASVPFMITMTQRQKLYELGYERKHVDALSPSDALNIIKVGLSHDAYAAEVRATWRRKPQNPTKVPEVIHLSGEIVGATAVEGKSTPSPQPPATVSAETPSSLRSESEQYRHRRRSEEQRPH